MPATQNPTLILAGLCAAGMLTGFVVRRGTFPSQAVADVGGVSQQARSRAATTRHPPAAPDIASFPERHSTETAESLAKLPDDNLYASLALWLADATEPEIAAFWKDYSQKKDASNDITDLIFLNWTRLDPKAAIVGSSSDPHAWWAWACHDPDAALAEARANSPNHVNDVARGIGEFRQEWLRAHYNELSGEAQATAMEGMTMWDDRQNPLAAIKFRLEIGNYARPDLFKALIRQDPWAALDWVKESRANPQTFGHNLYDPMKFVVDSMAADRPDDLERLAAQTPSGQLKGQMESALFKNLLETDPDVALEKARSTTVPRTAAERYAAIGNGLVKTDSEQAFAIAKDLFTACPNALSMSQTVLYPDGASGSSEAVPGVGELVKALVNSDPQRALEMTVNLKAGNAAFGTISDQWARQDLQSYANWVNGQTDEKLRAQGANYVIDRLVNQQNYLEAADWAMAGNTSYQKYKLNSLFSDWNRKDPQAASEWLENADLPVERKNELKPSLAH